MSRRVSTIVLKPDPVDGAADVRRTDEDGRLGQQLERRRVEVVEVQVGDQHDVDVAPDRRIGQLAVAPQRPDPALQHRIGQDAHAVHLDQDRALTDEGHARGARRLRLSHSHGPTSGIAFSNGGSSTSQADRSPSARRSLYYRRQTRAPPRSAPPIAADDDTGRRDAGTVVCVEPGQVNPVCMTSRSVRP